MRSIISTAATVAVLYLRYAQAQTPESASQPKLNTPTYAGCYSSAGSLVDQGPWTYQTLGYCQPICVGALKPVLGLANGTNCWCGDSVPSAATKVDDSQCDVSCAGYGTDTCKSLIRLSIFPVLHGPNDH
jgi:cell wall integrity and stress response component